MATNPGPLAQVIRLPIRKNGKQPSDGTSTRGSRLGGLFRLPDRGEVEISLDRAAGRWLINAAQEVVIDVLTSVCIYQFGHEPFKRVVLSRTTGAAMKLLTEYGPRILPQLPDLRTVTSQHFEFGIEPAAEVAWKRIVRSHQVRRANAIQSIRSGMSAGAQPLRQAA